MVVVLALLLLSRFSGPLVGYASLGFLTIVAYFAAFLLVEPTLSPKPLSRIRYGIGGFFLTFMVNDLWWMCLTHSDSFAPVWVHLITATLFGGIIYFCKLPKEGPQGDEASSSGTEIEP